MLSDLIIYLHVFLIAKGESAQNRDHAISAKHAQRHNTHARGADLLQRPAEYPADLLPRIAPRKVRVTAHFARVPTAQRNPLRKAAVVGAPGPAPARQSLACKIERDRRGTYRAFVGS